MRARSASRYARRAIASAVVLAALGAALTSPASASILPDGSTSSSSPTIWSDQPDYNAGATVTLWGAGWQAGEAVHIHVNDDQGQTWSFDDDVTADGSGDITDVLTLPSTFIAQYRVTATGTDSGTATTTFTDGAVTFNMSTSQSASTTSFQFTRFDKDGCDTTGASSTKTETVTPTTSAPESPASSKSWSIGTPSAPAGFTFTGWTVGSDTGSAFPGGCQSFNGAALNLFAHFTSTNHAPAVAATNSTVTVNEGTTAANSGTWSDADAGDTVNITASSGTLTQTGTHSSGTWSWSAATTDGPSQSQTVTITANDGHTTTTTTFSLVVSNVAPVVTAPVDQTANEGASTSFTLGSFTDPGADTPWAVDVNWGDGTSHTTFNATTAGSLGSQNHIYADNGVYTVTVSVTDKDGSNSSKTFKVTVANVPPSLTAPADQTANEGASTSFTLGSFTDPGADTPWAVDVNWGDSTADTTFNQTTTGSLGSRTHTFAQNGIYTVTVNVTDKDNGTGSKTFKVTVSNVAPTVTAAANQTASEGSSTSFSLGSFTDPGPDNPWAVDVNWGDASSHATFNATTPGSLGNQDHTYADNGSYTVTVKVTDKDGGSDQKTFTVTVANVAPTATFGNDGPVSEGSSFHLTLTGASDPSSADTAAGLQYAFDCGTGSGYGTFGSSNTATCPTTDNGTRSVKGEIKDKDNGITEYTGSVVVSNVAPSATFSNDGPVNEGSSFHLSLTSPSDPSSADTTAGFTYSFNCGDGAGYSSFATSSSATCPTNDSGARSVMARIKDKDNGISEYTSTVTVRNVAPTATFSNDGPVGEGSSFHLTLTGASDPSSADTTAGFTYAFDCGSGYGAFDASNSATCPTSDNGTRAVKAEIRDKDGGTTEYTDTVTVTNVAPTASFSNNGPVDEGSSFTLKLTNPSDPSTVDTATGLKYAFDCGDGGGYGALSSSATATCPTSDNGTRHVRAEIQDKDGGTTEYTDTVQVDNVAPTATFSNDGPVNEGSSFHLSLTSASDPSSADTAAGFKYAYDCGTGSGYGSFGTSNTASCPTNDNGSRTVKAKIMDKDGGITEYTDSVQVNNVAPTATFSDNGPVNEGSDIQLKLTNPTDPSSIDTAAGFTYAFDCGDGAGFGSFSSSATTSCPTSDNGTRTVKAQIRDKDGGTSAYSDSVTIDNVPPAVTAPSDQSSDEGSSVAFDLGSFTDPGADSPWAVDVNWGDGSADTTFNQTTTGALGTIKHTYIDGPASETVTVTVTDKDGGSDSKTFTVTVNNVPPTVTLDPNNDTSVDEGTTHTYRFTATDPGVNDTLSPSSGYPDCDAGQTNNGTLIDGSYTFDQATGKGSFQCFFANGPATANVKIKMTDSDGGSSSASESVQVVTIANVPPTVTAPADQSSNEGASHSFALGSFTDPGPDAPWAVDINWGDGSPDATFNAATTGDLGTADHTYDDNGTYTATVTVTDADGGSDSQVFSVEVKNVPPTATFSDNSPVNEGSDIVLKLTNPTDPSSADTHAGFTYAFDCGSGYGTFTSDNTVTCPTNDNGIRSVKAQIQDKDGGITQYTDTVEIDNVAPTATFSNDGPVSEGSSFHLSLTGATDPSSADNAAGFTYAFDCGNGYGDFSNNSTATCPTTDNGTRTVKAQIRDKDGGITEYTDTVQVDNVAPTATFSNDGPVNEGSNFHLSLTGATDPSSADTAAGFQYAFNCDDGNGYSDFSSDSTATCPTSDNGTRNVKAKIEDKDGGVREYTDTVTVRNVPPAVTAPNDQSSDEGSSVAFDLGSFTDPGADSPWAVDINWGDGTPHTTFNATTTGTLGARMHTYADGPATETVTVTVTDKDGASDSASFTVTVNNVPPTVTLDPNNDTSVDEGTTHTYKFTATDPGVLDVLSPSAGYPNCDASATNNGTLVDSSYTFDQATGKGSFQCFFPNGPATANVKIKMTDSDGGSSSASESVQVISVANVPPTVTAPADQSSNEGASHSFSLGSFTDPGPDAPWAVDVNWGDGTPDTTFNATSTGSLGSKDHTYDDNKTYTVAVTVTDADGGAGSTTFKATVANVAPTATFSDNGPVNEGSNITLKLSNPTDPSSADTAAGFKYAYDCGTGSGYGSFGTSNTASCPTTDNGSRTVQAKIMDKDGGITEYTDTVEIDNVAPAATFSNDGPVNEGSSFHLSLTNPNDPSSVDTAAGFTYAFNCGDSNGYSTFSATATATCATNDSGIRYVKAEIRDKDGGTTEYIDTVTVRNVAPTGSLASNGPVSEGGSVTVDFDHATDASSVDASSLHFLFNCGGVVPDVSAVTYAAASPSNTKSCTFHDNGTYTITGAIVDKDGGVTTGTTTVQVNNVPPTVTAASAQTTAEGTATAIALGSFSDPGFDNPWSVQVAWGDGTPNSTFNMSATGSLGTRMHTYDDGPADETVTVTVTDKDGGVDSKTFTVHVTNVAPTGNLSNGGPVGEGSPVSVSFASPSDASSADASSLHYAFDCTGADLSAVTYAAASATNGSHCTFPDNGSYAVTGVVIDKDGGRHADTTTVQVNNVAPTVNGPANQTSNEGSAASFSLGSFGDPGPDSPWSVDIGWGDGRPHTTFTSAAAGSLGSAMHTYDDNGTYTVTVKVTDKDGATGTATYTVTVANVAPTATFGNDGPVNEGSSFHLSLTNPGDPSGADTTAGFSYAFDCGDGSGYGAWSATSSATCLTTDNGSRSVRGKIKDKDGGTTEYTATVAVNNVAPTITSFTGTTTFAGPLAQMPSTFTTAFGDPGTADTWSAFFTWGDGTPTTQTVNPFVTGQTQTHTFTTAGCSKTVTVKVSDDDGGYDTRSTTVGVGTASFLAPMTNQPVTNKLKNGQVLPVKVQFLDCSGAPVTGLQPAIRLVDGDQTAAADDTIQAITPQSVSAADTTGIMRYTDTGTYMYNLSVNLAKLNTDYTIVIYPYGTATPSQTLRHVIQATK